MDGSDLGRVGGINIQMLRVTVKRGLCCLLNRCRPWPGALLRSQFGAKFTVFDPMRLCLPLVLGSKNLGENDANGHQGNSREHHGVEEFVQKEVGEKSCHQRRQ